MTAVEFLIEEVECRGIITKELKLAFEQAKEMEKQQIIDAYDDGYYENGMGRYEPEEYYNNTYNLSQQDKP